MVALQETQLSDPGSPGASGKAWLWGRQLIWEDERGFWEVWIGTVWLRWASKSQ